VTRVIAAAEWGGEFDGALDPIIDLFRFPPLWEIEVLGVDLSINRTILIAWVMTLLAGLLMFMAFREPKIVPGKLQAFGEMIIDFVRQIILDIIGPKGLKFLPLLTTMFIFIFFMNVAKITPFMMMPPTSRMAWPLFLALVAWVVYVGVGMKEQGAFGYFKHMVVIPGVPKAILPFLGLIELVSNLILRPFTLAVRLFANMVAGHILVVITLVTIHVFLPSPAGWPIGIFGLIASPVVFAFELFIIGLQAYIFVMLTAVYIDSSLEAAH
jgi:F-type H+-transporting ATPase subunit a